jgi:hypothetical protein
MILTRHNLLETDRPMKQYCRIAFILLTVALVNANYLSAQISIDRAFFESQRGKRYSARTFEIGATSLTPGVTSNINSIIAQVGANKVFDFRNLPFPSQPSFLAEVRYLANGESHPYANESLIKDANLIGTTTSPNVPDTTVWSYMRLSDASFSILASGFTTSNGNDILFGPLSTLGAVSEPLPQTLGTEWEVIFFDLDNPPVRQVSKSYNKIDAWGTLLLPGGRSIPSLRERIDIEVKFFLNGVEFPALGTPRTTIGYSYQTLEGPSASIFFEFDPEQNKYVPDEVSYTLQSVQSSTSMDTDNKLIPEGFNLFQNYPNPFNPSTTISYSIPFRADVTLRISELTGRTISKITFPNKSAGNHTFTFNAQDMSSGIYVYSIEAGGYRTSRMFTLIK